MMPGSKSGGENATEAESSEREARERGDPWWGWYWLAAPNPTLDVPGRDGSGADSPGTDASGEHAPLVASVHWGVLVEPSDGVIRRRVYRRLKRGFEWYEWPVADPYDGWKPEQVIWPTYGPRRFPPESQGGGAHAARWPAPLGTRAQSLAKASDRVRDSAKWLAAILGAALATLVGTSPLSDLRTHGLPGMNMVFGVVGLTALAVVLILLLRVMRPQTTEYEDVYRATKGTLGEWRRTVEAEPDLYLPPGVNCLITLRQALIVEEITLLALSNAMTTHRANRKDIAQALGAREERLREWQDASARVTSIAAYHQVLQRSDVATYLGTLLGLIGIVGVIAAVIL
jgi:hypothetical protein